MVRTASISTVTRSSVVVHLMVLTPASPFVSLSTRMTPSSLSSLSPCCCPPRRGRAVTSASWSLSLSPCTHCNRFKYGYGGLVIGARHDGQLCLGLLEFQVLLERVNRINILSSMCQSIQRASEGWKEGVCILSRTLRRFALFLNDLVVA